MSNYYDYNYGKRSLGDVLAYILVGVMVIGFIFLFARSCTPQAMTKSWGGEIDVELDPNQKLVNITWKDDSLWILTKDMQKDDIAENYTYKEQDVTGWLEGEVRIKETKLSPEELKIYEEQKILEEDFYKSSNYKYIDETGETKLVFIEYDVETDTYTKVQEYVYDEYGEMKSKK